MSQPYSQFAPYGDVPPRPPSSSWKWLAVLGAFGGVLLLGCCGGAALLVVFGLNLVSHQVADELRDHPIVQQELGGIEEISIDYTASFAREDDDEFVYRVEGPKGKGILIAKSISNDAGGEDVESATLRTSDGRSLQLAP